jgi:hypothetical protein
MVSARCVGKTSLEDFYLACSTVDAGVAAAGIVEAGTGVTDTAAGDDAKSAGLEVGTGVARVEVTGNI